MPVREPETLHTEPTAEERRLRAFFVCSDCSLEWPTRLRHPYQARRCRNCGLARRRRMRDEKRRAAIVETKNAGTFDFNKPEMMEPLRKGFDRKSKDEPLTPELARERRAVDAAIEDAIERALRLGRMEKAQAVVDEPRKRLPKNR